MSAKKQLKGSNKKQTWIIVSAIGFALLCVVAKGYSIFSDIRYEKRQAEEKDILEHALVPVQSAMVNYEVNHNGALPVDSRWTGSRNLECSAGASNTADCFVKNYVNSTSSNTLKDAGGNYYNLRIMTLSSGEEKVLDTFDQTIYIIKNAVCDESKAYIGDTRSAYGADKAIYSSNKRDYVLMYYLEIGKSYCLSK